MENASKAIIIAGGMLIAIAIVSLLVWGWRAISSYQSSKNSLKDIEDTAKFNEQFAQYDRDDVMGYELLSLINQIQDYDERLTTDSIKASNDKYVPIGIVIKLDSSASDETKRKKFTVDDEPRLFKDKNEYIAGDLTTANDGKRPNTFKTLVEKKVEKAIHDLSGNKNDEKIAMEIAKSIDAIFMVEDPEHNNDMVKYRADKYYNGNKEQVYQEIANKYNSITKANPGFSAVEAKNQLVRTSRTEKQNSNKYYTAACTYYEYMQFKKGIFKCNNVEYDTSATGRVTALEFEFTGDIR